MSLRLYWKCSRLHSEYSEYFTFTGNLKIIHGFKYDFLLLFVAEYLKKGFGQGNSIITTDAEQLQKIT